VPIKVLLVDDSPTARLMLSQMITSAPDLKLVGQAVDGLQAVQMVVDLSPDIVLMDVTMPRMDGLQATREIMNVKPTPIVVISETAASNETNLAFEAVNAGALQLMRKPGHRRCGGLRCLRSNAAAGHGCARSTYSGHSSL